MRPRRVGVCGGGFSLLTVAAGRHQLGRYRREWTGPRRIGWWAPRRPRPWLGLRWRGQATITDATRRPRFDEPDDEEDG